MSSHQRHALDRMLDAIQACCETLQDRAMACRVASLRLRLAGFDPAEVDRALAPFATSLESKKASAEAA